MKTELNKIINRDDVKDNSVIILKTNDLSVHLSDLVDQCDTFLEGKMKNIVYVLLKENESIDCLSEEEMNHAGWYKKKDEKI